MWLYKYHVVLIWKRYPYKGREQLPMTHARIIETKIPPHNNNYARRIIEASEERVK